MKCVIPGINIKIFARAIHSLARVGDELYVEPSGSGVFFRTVNSSRSAFGSFFFKSGFFSLYDFKVPETQLEESFKCKVAMKACLNAFKFMNTIERSVEKCRLIVDPEKDRLVVDMTCRHGIHKTYNLSFIECETLQAVFDKSKCRFGTSSHSRLFCDAFMNFQSNQEEVTLAAFPEKMLIRNYVDDDPDPAKAIHTELTLEADEFDSYDIDENAEVTFCLKEVRSLLYFSEPANLPISLVFNRPGSPIIFTVETPTVEANFILATLSLAMEPTQTEPSVGSQQASRQGSKAIPERKSAPLKHPSKVSYDSRTARNVRRRSSDNFSEFPSGSNSNHTDALPPASPSTSASLKRHDLDGLPTSEKKSAPIVLSPINKDKSSSIPNGSGKIIEERRVERRKGQKDVDDDEEDVVPGTPPAKRKRVFFKRCFEPTFDANNISTFRQILAEDSEEES